MLRFFDDRLKLKRVQRVRQIINIFIKYGFENIVSNMGLLPFLRKIRLNRLSGRERGVIQVSSPERIRMMLEELGPSFIKLGQMLSLRSDMLPDNLTDELRKLQFNAAQMEYSRIKAVIEEDLQNDIGKIFAEFSETPLASASIAQVHRARLHSGEQVVVKIQKPGIRMIIEKDIRILYDLAHLAERYIKRIRSYRPVQLVEQFAQTIRLELDFQHEARTMILFKEAFQKDRTVYIPGVFLKLNTERVLVMEYVPGYVLTEIWKKDLPGIDRKKLARNGTEFILRQIFDYGFFNADPHPGNFIIRSDNILVPIDFGMVGFIDRHMKAALLSILASFIQQDAEKLLKVFLKERYVTERVKLPELRHELNNVINFYRNIPLKHISIVRIIRDLNAIIRQYNIQIPPEVAMTIKVFLSVDCLGKMLDPDMEIIAQAKPFIGRLFAARFNPRRIAAAVTDFGEDLGTLLKEFPYNANILMKELNDGSFTVNFDVRDLPEKIRHLDRLVSRISASIIVAGLLVGSSLVLQFPFPLTIFGFSLLGMAGYLVSAVIGLWLLIGILRSGKK